MIIPILLCTSKRVLKKEGGESLYIHRGFGIILVLCVYIQHGHDITLILTLILDVPAMITPRVTSKTCLTPSKKTIHILSQPPSGVPVMHCRGGKGGGRGGGIVLSTGFVPATGQPWCSSLFCSMKSITFPWCRRVGKYPDESASPIVLAVLLECCCPIEQQQRQNRKTTKMIATTTTSTVV